ncbi:DNA topoisomerase 2-beta [Tyrophagus putrescentiae]|nr:DNA topoisomerase 2-beta [Tyrophagus putrescentiae]
MNLDASIEKITQSVFSKLVAKIVLSDTFHKKQNSLVRFVKGVTLPAYSGLCFPCSSTFSDDDDDDYLTEDKEESENDDVYMEAEEEDDDMSLKEADSDEESIAMNNSTGDKFAGTTRAKQTTLIIVEGPSAIKAVKSGLFVLEKSFVGILSLQGKLINAKDSTDARVKSNKWIKLIVNSLGLDFNKKYTTKSEQKELRYGKILIMADPDVNGTLIAGMILTFFHKYWPALLKRKNMFSKMKFPIVSEVSPLLKL